MLQESHFYFNKAADILGLPSNVRDILLTPMRSVKVDVSIESESGELLNFIGFRVQHNKSRGPMKGGLRFHPSMDEDHATALANLMTRSFEITQWTNNIHGHEHGRIDDLSMFSQQTYGEPDSFQTLESTITLDQAEDFATQGITALSCTPDEDCAYIYYAPCVFDVGSKSSERFAELSGSMNNLPYQMLFSRIAHQVQQNYEKLTQINDPTILKSAVTTILQRLISSTGDGASLGVTVSNTDDDSGRHIISIRATTGEEILSGSEVEFGLMV